MYNLRKWSWKPLCAADVILWSNHKGSEGLHWSAFHSCTVCAGFTHKYLYLILLAEQEGGVLMAPNQGRWKLTSTQQWQQDLFPLDRPESFYYKKLVFQSCSTTHTISNSCKHIWSVDSDAYCMCEQTNVQKLILLWSARVHVWKRWCRHKHVGVQLHSECQLLGCKKDVGWGSREVGVSALQNSGTCFNKHMRWGADSVPKH